MNKRDKILKLALEGYVELISIKKTKPIGLIGPGEQETWQLTLKGERKFFTLKNALNLTK